MSCDAHLWLCSRSFEPSYSSVGGVFVYAFQLLAEGDPTPLQGLLQNIGTFFTTSITWLGQVLNTVVSTPALLIMVLAMPICGFAVGLLTRLIRL